MSMNVFLDLGERDNFVLSSPWHFNTIIQQITRKNESFVYSQNLLHSSIMSQNSYQDLENPAPNRRMYRNTEGPQSPCNRDYLDKFSKYLEQRLSPDLIVRDEAKTSPTHKSELNRTNTLLVSHLEKKKLTDNNSEHRINKILNEFKNVDTYVNIKNFIQEMNSANHEIMLKQMENQKSIQSETPKAPKNIFEAARQENFKQLMQNSGHEADYNLLFQKANIYAGTEINKNIIKSSEFVNEFARKLHLACQHNNTSVDEKSDIYSFESMLYNQLFQVQDQTEGFLPQSQIENKVLSKKQRLHLRMKEKEQKHLLESEAPVIVDQKYYQEFRKKASDVQSKLHEMLQHMYIKKWKKRQNQIRRMRKQTKIQKTFFNQLNNPNKPVLSSKYRLYAPKNVFVFKDENGEVPQPTNKWKIRRHGKILLEKSKNYDEHALASLHNQIKIEQKKQKVLKPSKNALFNEIKQIKAKYNFKNPLVKQNILKKIVDFIKDVEDQQYGFKKNNQQLNRTLNKFEQTKQMDFNKFFDENFQINTEELKNLQNNKKLK